MSKFLRQIFLWLFALFLVLLLLNLVRWVLVDVVTISNNSMAATLVEGDKVFLNKAAFQLRLDNELQFWPIPWKIRIGETPLKILSFTDPQVNDIIVFEDPLQSESDNWWIKRIMAAAGDTIEMIGGNIYLNGEKFTEPQGVQNDYFVQMKEGGKAILDSLLQNRDGGAINNSGLYRLALTDSVARILEAQDAVDYVSPSERQKQSRVESHTVRFFTDSIEGWNLDYFGPFWVPSKGTRIELNDRMSILYESIIERETSQTLKSEFGRFALGDSTITSYQFERNYYFVLGDNRDRSKDSRHWGFLAHDKIVGKVWR